MPNTLDLNLTIHADYPSMTARFHLQDAAAANSIRSRRLQQPQRQ